MTNYLSQWLISCLVVNSLTCRLSQIRKVKVDLHLLSDVDPIYLLKSHLLTAQPLDESLPGAPTAIPDEKKLKLSVSLTGHWKGAVESEITRPYSTPSVHSACSSFVSASVAEIIHRSPRLSSFHNKKYLRLLLIWHTLRDDDYLLTECDYNGNTVDTIRW